jgi:hypothetical protein
MGLEFENFSGDNFEGPFPLVRGTPGGAGGMPALYADPPCHAAPAYCPNKMPPVGKALMRQGLQPRHREKGNQQATTSPETALLLHAAV